MIRILLSILLVLSFCSESFAQRVTSPPQRIRFGTTLPSTCTNGMLFQDTDATAGQQIYACESGAWVLQGDGGSGSVSDTAYAASWDGVTTTAPSKNAVYDKIETIASGGDNITVNTTAATNANFLDNLYIDWAIDTAATPDDITSKFNYAETLAGNPALLTTEVVFTADGLLAEGTTADTIEIKLAFPDPATTDKTITLPNATDTLVGRDTTDTFTNKTFDTAGTGNSFSINGTAISAVTGTGSVVLATAPTIATSLTGSYLTASEILITGASKEIISAAVATYPSLTELTYVKGVTSAIQTQLNTKDAVTTAGRSLTRTTNDFAADAELYTDTKCIWFEYPTAADDFKSIWTTNIAATITGITCESDQTVNFDLQVDDGTPTGVNGSDIACTTFARDGTLAGDTTVAVGDRLDIALTSVSGIPTWVSICFDFTYDD